MPKRNKHAVGKRKRQNQREHDDQFAKRQRTTHFGERDDHFLRRDAITAAHPEEFIKSLRIIQIPNDAVGFVIGKGGGTIKYLRCESGAEIHVTSNIDSDLFSVERDVKLRGSARSIAKAQQLIKDLLDKHEFIKSQLRIIQIPNDMVGFVIGKGGKTIKYLELESGANIQVTTGNDSDPSALVRDIKLRGSAVSIAKAEMLIKDLLAKAGSRDSVGVGQSVSQPKLSPTLIGDFKFYERLEYCAPFRILVDALFLEKYFLEETNAVETIQNLLGGRFILLFTNCVYRNIGQKDLQRRITGVDYEMYHCKDSQNDLRKDLNCIQDVIREDGLKEKLILATGNELLYRLMKKLDVVPIIHFHILEAKDKADAREIVLEAFHEKRNVDLLKKVDFKESPSKTVKVLVDDGFLRRGLRYYNRHVKPIVNHISRLVGHQVVLCSTRCSLKKRKKPSRYIRTAFTCVHTGPRTTSDYCITRAVETAEYGIQFVATTSKKLKKDLSKMPFVNVISFSGRELILNRVNLSHEAKDTAAKATPESVLANKELGEGSSSRGNKRKQVNLSHEAKDTAAKATPESVLANKELGEGSSSRGKKRKQVRVISMTGIPKVIELTKKELLSRLAIQKDFVSTVIWVAHS